MNTNKEQTMTKENTMTETYCVTCARSLTEMVKIYGESRSTTRCGPCVAARAVEMSDAERTRAIAEVDPYRIANEENEMATLRSSMERKGYDGDYIDSHVKMVTRKRKKAREIRARYADPITCNACDGFGRISAFAHIQNGRCFTCGGNGKACAENAAAR